MKIDPSKKYTSGGHPVEHLHRAPEGWPSVYPWRGLVDGVIKAWTDEGRLNGDYPDARFDLIEVREPLRAKVAVHPNGNPAHLLNDDTTQAGMSPGWRIVEMVEVMPANNPPTA
jgi:hypothetical protein